MVSMLGAHRRAEQFAAAVDGRSPRDDLSPDLLALVDVVGDLRAHQAPEPRLEFSAALREQLMVEAQSVLTPVSPLALPPRRADRARQRRLTAAAAAFTLVGGSVGLAAAAEQAVPGDALYPIKRGIEDAQLGLQSEPSDKGRAYLDQAEERLDEATALIEAEAPAEQVAQSVDLFVVQAVAGSDLLLASYGADGSPEDVSTLRDFSAEALARLQEAAETAPAEIQDELARAAMVVQGIDQQASEACASCSDRPALEMPVLMAQAAQISQAMEAVRSQEVTNDHPTLEVDIPTRPLTSNNRRSESGTGEAGSGDATTGDGPRLSLGSELPRDAGEALKQLDDATGGLVGKVGETTDDTVRRLQDGVEKTLEGTLDPDADLPD